MFILIAGEYNKRGLMKESNKIEQQIDYLKKHGHFFDEYLEFYQKILTMQHSKKSNINKDRLSLFSKKVDLDNRLAAGLPLIDHKNLYIEETFSESFFQELITLFEQYPTQYEANEISNIQEAFQKKYLIITELIRNFAAKNAEYFIDLADNIKVDQGLLAFVAKTISLPLFETYREILLPQLNRVDSVWFKPLCPLCGNVPGMARLEKEVGQRYVWCSTCNSQWTFARIQCPFCLNKDQNQLRYFYDEENKPYRVYVCDNCKRYIKTIDERQTDRNPDILMATEDMITQYLDDLAIKEGFQNAVWWTKLDNSQENI